MEPKKHLVSLECLCVKKADVSVASSATVSAKISCKTANVTSKIRGRGWLGSSGFPQATEKKLIGINGGTYSANKEHKYNLLFTANDIPENVALTDIKAGLHANIETNGIVYTYLIEKYDNVADVAFSFSMSFAYASWGEEDSSFFNNAGLSNLKFWLSDAPTRPKIRPVMGIRSKLTAEGNLTSRVSSDIFGESPTLTAVGQIVKSDITANYSPRETIASKGSLVSTTLEKLVGDFGDYDCVQKLYPTADVQIDSALGEFVGPYKESGNLYKFIDEGVFTGDYDKHLGQSTLVADDSDFIQPNTFTTSGIFQYKSKVNNVLVRPDVTRFRMRASAPLRNYESAIPPRYTVYDIKLIDPSGNLVVEYEDIVFRGDSDQDQRLDKEGEFANRGFGHSFFRDGIKSPNYSTFSSAPKKNMVTELYEWQDGFPRLQDRSDYTIQFNVKVEALDDSFDQGFDKGFEERYILENRHGDNDDYLALDGAPISTQDLSLINPTKNIRISAIEICNSGLFGLGYGPRPENYLGFYVEVPAKGRRIERRLVPTFMPHAEFDTGVWPSVSSIWYPNDLPTSSNQDECGSEHIIKNISDGRNDTFATLHTIGPHLDSGKLTVKFSPSSDTFLNEVTKGAFHFGFDQTTANSWYSPSGSFNSENKTLVPAENGYFKVDSVTLKVRAKKDSADVRNFVFDVVGYSDDKLLNITKAPSGFLQNPSGVQVNNIIMASEGAHPYVSGFHPHSDDFALGGDSLSEKDNHFEASGNAGGDHYSLTTYPVVNSTDWAEYEVPLQIFDDDVKIGKSRDYSVSSMFENLYLDIYPLPSGASISDMSLLVRFAPQDAFNLSIEGGEKIRRVGRERSEAKLFPTARNSATDVILNAGSGYGPLSKIENIPHAYASPSSVKTNYSRRWKGQTGAVAGAFDVDVFDFGFNNPHVAFPFKIGYYDFAERSSSTNFKSRNEGLRLLTSGTHIPHSVTLHNGNYQFDVIKNVGWRFSSGTLFEKHLPSFTTAYQTTDWTSYSNGGVNFQNDDLYGKISDAFDTAVRVSGQAGGKYIKVSPTSDIINTASGFSLFLRFTPDQNVSGVGHNLFDSGVLASKWQTANNLDFALGYSGGYLSAYAKDVNGNVIHISDTLKYHAYQYPLSILLTYNDHQSRMLKLYTDNEANQHTYTDAFEDSYDGGHVHLRASSAPFTKIDYPTLGASDPDINLGWSAGSGVGMNMFVTEFGLSTFESGVNSASNIIYPYGSGTNIVEANPDRSHKQVTAEEFFNGHRSKFYEPQEGHNTDSYELWSYVDEDTTADWELGGFRHMQFNLGFASLASKVGKRKGRDLINFHLDHHGSGYIQSANFAMPSNVDSGVAYHTQIENDFLRFHLSEASDNFYSVHRRITKNLPAGYKFTEDALVVDTIVQHQATGDITWDKCIPTANPACTEHRHSYETLSGPKLIVSLYTKRQEPRWSTAEPNWGLVNRDVHYLNLDESIVKFSSKFSYDELTDESEKWALFPNEPRYKDFGERYFSDDVNDMFLQYDIVYPSGGPFTSDLKVHSAHVRMDHANVKSTTNFGDMNIFASGGNVLNENLTTYISGSWYDGNPQNSGMNLNILGPLFVNSGPSGLFLTASGALQGEESMPFYTFAVGTLDTSWNPPGMTLFTDGEIRTVAPDSGSFNLVLPNVLGTSTIKMPLALMNTDTTDMPSGGYLDLSCFASSGSVGVRPVPLVLNIAGRAGGGNIGVGSSSGSLNLNIFGFGVPENRFPVSSMPLFIDTPLDIKASMPLYISNIPNPITTSVVASDGSEVNGMNLFAANYGGAGSDYLMWYNENYGTSILESDNSYASVPVGDEIRGVDLIGFGSCDGDSPRKAKEPAIVTDDTIWREPTCEEGGIFRAISTYTNIAAGYSGNYYGIRKYTGLKPGSPYNATLNIVTGNTHAIKVARDLEDWEYGHCGPEHFVDAGGNSGCCNDGCDGQSLVYSGGKLIGDYPLINNNRDLTPVSGRNTDDQYGRSVSVIGDLMAVGSPNTHVPYIDEPTDSELQIDDAGAIFLYRRGPEVAGRKASWTMEDKLMLPSGYRKDYVSRSVANLVRYDQWSISGKQWNVGQEGRKLGSSLDICSSGDRETIVAGAPFAKWTREFDTIKTSGIPVAMVVFTDSFNYNKGKAEKIANSARKWDILYKYFSAPWFGATNHEFQPQLDIKLLVFQITRATQDRPKVKHDHDWFHHTYLSRMDDKQITDEYGHQAIYDEMLSGVKLKFKEAFKHQFGPHSGIPPIMGIFREKSNSAGLGAFYNPLDKSNIVDDFVEFYNDYSYASGVIDPEVAAPYNAESGYLNKIFGASEDWAETSITLLNETLDSGNLIRENALRYITSGVGQEWAQDNAYEFQIPPSSGGRVFVFEKESGIFNCVQVIKSFADRESNNIDDDLNDDEDYQFGYGMKYNDRYGHSVSISKNSEIISVGSPYTQTPCEIYERDDTENTRLYGKIRDYLVSINDTNAIARYDLLLTESGVNDVGRVLYHEMTPDNKLSARIKNKVKLYKPIFNYSYGDIKTTGTWQFILGEFLGTSRLGYSTAVSDDGDIVAFGAPTDSTTLFEDSNIWYKGKNTWASYTNAGAVRVFESKKIYPHSGVVEFTRFGNLDRSLHPEERDQGLYDQMGLYFEPSNLPFRRTEFEEIEIPRDAGLAFIITPELDADSDEIIQNIKDWLALGDRTLVLVGNDPTYEENGVYKESNDIVNRVLKKLGSRMTIVPAPDRYQSLPDCVSSTDVFNDKYNVTKAFQPTQNHTKFFESPITRQNMFARGVGDIRMDLSDVDLQDFIERSPCDKLNPSVCNLPLKHLGDLRSEWTEACEKTVGDRKIKIEYQKNWAWHFANPNPAQGCDDYPESPRPFLNRPYEDIVPILTAAEWLPDTVKIIPARSGVDCEREYCFKEIKIKSFTTHKEFAKDHEDFVSFSIFEDSTSELAGTFSSYDFGDFFDPDKKNGRDSILQAKGEPYAGQPIIKNRTLLPDSILALQESYYAKDKNDEPIKTNSNVIIMASMLGENSRSFGVTGDQERPSNNDDENILFYVNMLMKDCGATGKVLQLGGWTGRTSFKDAYSSKQVDQDNNVLKERLESMGIEVEENFVETDPTALFPELDKVTGSEITTLWIANPEGRPDDLEAGQMREFLERGNKRIVITYAGNHEDNAQAIAGNVDYLCSVLNLGSRPCFVPSIGEYFVQQSNSLTEGNKTPYPYGQMETPTQILNPETIPTTGCREGFAFYGPHGIEPVDTKVGKFALWPDGFQDIGADFAGENAGSEYIPISGGGDFKRILSYADPIRDREITIPELYRIDAKGQITLPTLPGSGYRLFLNYVSETSNDHFEVYADFGTVSFDADSPPDDPGQNGAFTLTKTALRTPETITRDFVAKGETATFDFSSLHTFIKPEDEQAAGRGLPPQTVRLLSISGCPLPIETIVTSRTKIKKVPCDPPYKDICTSWYVPEKRFVIPGEFRPIKHVSDPYCNPFALPCDEDPENCCPPRGETEIEDGPVIAAEEFEHFSAGTNGNNRSKIVVISDSTLLQGQCPQYRSDALGENQEFIRSLYPVTATRRDIGAENPLAMDDQLGGRKFEFTQKLRSPERGSPAKYYAASGVSNTIDPLYGAGGVKGNLNKYVDNEDTYLPANPGFVREKNPLPQQIGKKIEEFGTSVALGEFGLYPRFSGDFLGLGSYIIDGGEPRDYIVDADSAGGLPELMKLTGNDYLDFDVYDSGCPGDLFGFSIDLSQDKLVVGTPFNGFRTQYAASGVSGIVQWHEIENSPTLSGLDVSENGGGGAAFYFERTGSGTNVRDEFLPWEWKQKIKPDSVDAGLITRTISFLSELGTHNLDSDFVLKYAKKPDQFGYSVAIDSDMIAVGSPNHNFDTLHDHSIYSSGEFIRKEFGREFVIPHHVMHDLGSSGVRFDKFGNASGTLVLNNGAVYTFKDSITHFPTRTREWLFKEKLYAQGHKDRTAANKFISALVSGCENDNFGWSVAVNRAKRSDSDYTLVGGAPFHDFATSGNHPQSASDATPVNGLESAGSAYTFDGMLREQLPSIPNSGGWIEVEVFGDKGESDRIRTRVYQPTSGPPKRVSVSGLLFANQNGDIFLEGSGFDSSEKGFIAHRPYVESVIGTAPDTTQEFDVLYFNTFGRPNSLDNAWPSLVGDEEFTTDFSYDMDSLNHRPSGLSLFIPAPSSAYVYNNMDINIKGASGVPSGDMPLFTMSTLVTNNLNINVSGEDASPSGELLINIRGR